jgi:hypothetical protein
MTVPAFDGGKYSNEIAGWCADQVPYSLEILFKSEAAIAEPGPIAEIGVHHGKFLIGAHNALGGQKALGIDLFDDQSRNVDGSGQGSLGHFRDAIAKFAAKPDLIDPMIFDSMEIGFEQIDEIYARFGRFKVFSVDGGHTPGHVINDLSVAQQLTSQNGVILVDDFFSPHWPGVTEGLMRFFLAGQNKFVPFLFLTNKLYLTGLSCHGRALAGARIVAEQLSDHIEFRPVSIFGYSALSGVGYR